MRGGDLAVITLGLCFAMFKGLSLFVIANYVPRQKDYAVSDARSPKKYGPNATNVLG